MSLSSSFHLLSFERKVQDALRDVERMLELERKPRLAADVDHAYGDKYALVDLTSNVAIIAYANCLERLGLDVKTLMMISSSIDGGTNKSVTLRFDASTTWEFSKEAEVDVPAERSWEDTSSKKTRAMKVSEKWMGGDDNSSSKKTRVMKAINHVTEFHWKVKNIWSISVYSGIAVEDKKVIKSRQCKTNVITQSKGGIPGSTNLPPVEMSLTWFLEQIDANELASKFKVDIEAEGMKTPRRNDAVQRAEEQWCNRIQNSFTSRHLKSIVQAHNPAIPKPQAHTVERLMGVGGQYSLFNPILPLMKDEGSSSNEDDDRNHVENKQHTIGLHNSYIDNDENKLLLSQNDMSKLLNQHISTLDVAISGLCTNWLSERANVYSLLQKQRCRFLSAI
ncbi:hypothetical protein ACHAW5_008057 [Stephanodiscus triporus]|uniref:Uncharacterized protein n=1 Tax=Stephanodiscus triporus TaxID=2934178 RepID=A0ABD3Q618_9STRA